MRWHKANPLIRRIRHHTTLATLFRSDDGMATERAAHVTMPVMGQALYTPATIPPEEPAEAIFSPLMGDQLPTQPANARFPEAGPDVETPATIPAQPGLSITSPAQQIRATAVGNTLAAIQPRISPARQAQPTLNATRPTNIVQPSIQPTAVNSLAGPTNQPEIGTGGEDPHWQRLRSIMERHRAVRSEPTPPAQPSERPTPDGMPSPAAGGETAQSTLLRSANKPNPPQAEQINITVRDQARVPPTSDVSEHHTQPLTQEVSMADPTTINQGLSNSQRSVVEAETAISAANSARFAGEMIHHPSTQQPVPLEAVWPVQQAGRELFGAESQRVPVQREILSATTTIDEPTTLPTAEMRERVVALPAKEPTESAVDVVMPRRPRPAPRPPATPSNTTGQTSSPAIAPPTRLPQPAEQQLPVSNDVPPSTSPVMIATEVGPLPADLWQILRRSPPANAISEPVSGGPTTVIQTQPNLTTTSNEVSMSAQAQVEHEVQAFSAPTRPSAIQMSAASEPLTVTSDNMATQHTQTTAGSTGPSNLFPDVSDKTTDSTSFPNIQRGQQGEDAQTIIAETVVSQAVQEERSSLTEAVHAHPRAADVGFPDVAPLLQPAVLPLASPEWSQSASTTAVTPVASAASVQRITGANNEPFPEQIGGNDSAQVSTLTDRPAKKKENAPGNVVESVAEYQPRIQRQELASAAPTSPQPVDEPTSDGAATTNEIDTDDLARQVYIQLRRRLAVERERLR